MGQILTFAYSQGRRRGGWPAPLTTAKKTVFWRHPLYIFTNTQDDGQISLKDERRGNQGDPPLSRVRGSCVNMINAEGLDEWLGWWWRPKIIFMLNVNPGHMMWILYYWVFIKNGLQKSLYNVHIVETNMPIDESLFATFDMWERFKWVGFIMKIEE